MTDKDLSSRMAGFLRNLADDIEKGNTQEDILRKTGEFIMSCIFMECVTSPGRNPPLVPRLGEISQEGRPGKNSKNGIKHKTKKSKRTDRVIPTDDEFSPDEFMKFITMGFYVYRMILQGETL